MPLATDSQIAMWRGAIALAWVDRQMNDAEKERLIRYFNDNIYLSDTQRAQLMQDVDQSIELKDVWGAITNPQDRAHLIDIAPSLFASHGGPTPAEKALYDTMVADQMATVDTNELQGELNTIEANIPAERAQEEADYKSEFVHWGPLDNLVYHLDKMMNNVT